MGIDITAFSLPILLTPGNTLYPISFLVGFFPLSLSLYYDVNRIGMPERYIYPHMTVLLNNQIYLHALSNLARVPRSVFVSSLFLVHVTLDEVNIHIGPGTLTSESLPGSPKK